MRVEHHDPEAAPYPLLELDEHGVAWLVLDQPGRRVNLLSTTTIGGLDRRLDELEVRVAEGGARGLIVTSRKRGCFLAGADLTEVGRMADAGEATAGALEAQRVLRRLEQLPVPSVAAIDGACLGSGLELALACGYRLASAAPHTRLGLPEVRVGTIPALGGTVRLPRLIGLQASLEMILSGEPVDAAEALRLGLVDEVVPASELEDAALSFALERVERGRIRTGARRRVPRRLLEDTAPGRRLVVARTARQLLARNQFAEPAPQRALEAVMDGVALPLERAFQRAAEIAGELLVTDKVRSLVHALRLLQSARRPQPDPPARVERVAVLGAGETGSQIISVLALADVPVRVKERSRDALLVGLRRVLSRIAVEVQAGALSDEVAEQRAQRVSGGVGFGGFGTADLVVAAVGDRVDTVVDALREVEEHTREECILATTLPLAPLDRLQQALRAPERVVGLHLLPPADRFPLLELAVGERTSAEAIAACRALAVRAGRVPLVVPASAGPLGARLLGAWLAEAIRMLDEGASLIQVDRVMEAFGMTLGPFRRADAMGVERALRLLHQLAERFGERMRPASVAQRLGGGTATFYRYRDGRPAGPAPTLPAGIPDSGTGLDDVIRDRLLLVLVNEAARILEEGAAGAADVDVASIAGLGFPRWRGGLLFHAERLGLPRLVEELGEHATRFGERYAPAPVLQRTAERSGSLYGTPRPPSGHVARGVL